MDMLSIAANPIVSSAAGILGSLATGVLQFFQRKQEHAFQLEDRRLTMETMKLQGNLDAARLAGELTAAREKGAADAFTESQRAEANLRGTGGWATILREFTRPGLTWFYQIFLLFVFCVTLTGWAAERLTDPLLQFIVVSGVNMANMTATWWFGQRQLEKVQVAWGNKTAGAKL